MSAQDCIFCKILKKEIPAKIVFENESNIAFLDNHPISKGHTIIVPKKHYQNLEDIPEEILCETLKTVKNVAKLLRSKLKIEGYNILQNNFEAAGQAIRHFHVHIIPRNQKDKKFEVKIPRNQASDDELNEVLNSIKK